MAEPTVLPATAAAAMADLHAAAFDDAWSASSLGNLMEGPHAFALGQIEGDRLTGFVLMRAIGPEAEVLTIAVDPTQRRRGVGASLMSDAIERCRSLGVEAIWLEVAEDNDAARALYARLGFALAGRRAGYYRRHRTPDVDALVLKRQLDPIRQGS